MALRKPSTVGSTTNPPSGSAIIKQSGGTFIIKMWRFQFNHSVDQLADIKGDGDAVPSYDHNNLQGGRYRIIGAMVKGAAMGLANLSSDSNNPGTLKIILDNEGDGGSVHTATVLVIGVNGSWWTKGVFIPVTIDCIITDTTPGNIEGSS